MHTAIEVFDAAFPPTSPALREWRFVFLGIVVFLAVEATARLSIWAWRRWRS